MNLQEKVQEFIRESDLIPSSVISEKTLPILRDGFQNRDTDTYFAFILGVEYAFEGMLKLLQEHNINPEL